VSDQLEPLRCSICGRLIKRDEEWVFDDNDDPIHAEHLALEEA
jgi:hypothetical protein